ncbi:hypothetical protein KBY83_02185 [Cyanobium sp. WKJ7-Wakatipu]|jgi:hypothetical protein|uniref:hypothetical protein n=1 Tax=Cyanobium sp. WKJ7-Wakatipu TaxID=2823726 RepID=UPI0020CC7CE3|nr:hypothetical protein [Cyanobium sp. WKJ7-Wakatipu]MCP9782128.1 hypothetical protein [Cyanobium sp. WKJ7-Wakatipu]
MVVTRHQLNEGGIIGIRSLEKRLTSGNVRNSLKLLVDADYGLAVFIKVHDGYAQVNA